MSKNIILTAVLILILVGISLTIFNKLTNNNSNGNSLLITPVLQKLTGQKASPTETPSNIVAPKTFKYDSSTDLKKELESINPKVLDSDFE